MRSALGREVRRVQEHWEEGQVAPVQLDAGYQGCWLTSVCSEQKRTGQIQGAAEAKVATWEAWGTHFAGQAFVQVLEL
jgi:hypothetical protein